MTYDIEWSVCTYVTEGTVLRLVNGLVLMEVLVQEQASIYT